MTFGKDDSSLRIDTKDPSSGGLTNGNSNGDHKRKPRAATIWHPSLKFKEESIPDPEGALELHEEREGWHGYVEWEKYPERKKKIRDWMKKFDFPGVSST
jgi:sulfite oxidase